MLLLPQVIPQKVCQAIHLFVRTDSNPQGIVDSRLIPVAHIDVRFPQRLK